MFTFRLRHKWRTKLQMMRLNFVSFLRKRVPPFSTHVVEESVLLDIQEFLVIVLWFRTPFEIVHNITSMHKVIFFCKPQEVFFVFNGSPWDLTSKIRILAKLATRVFFKLIFIKLAAVTEKRLRRNELILGSCTILKKNLGIE